MIMMVVELVSWEISQCWSKQPVVGASCFDVCRWGEIRHRVVEARSVPYPGQD